MNEWQNQRNLKIYKNRIKAAKSIIAKESHNRSHNYYKQTQGRESDSKDKRKGDFSQVLKYYGLQQYHRQLAIRGYDEQPELLGKLKEKEEQQLKSQLKLLPGHSLKLQQMITTIKKKLSTDGKNGFISFQEAVNNSNNTSKQITVKLPKIGSNQGNLLHKEFVSERSGLFSYPDKKKQKGGIDISLQQQYPASRSLERQIIKQQQIRIVKSRIPISSQKNYHYQGNNHNKSPKYEGVRLLPSLKKILIGTNIKKEEYQIQLIQPIEIKKMYKSYENALFSSSLINIDVEELTNQVAGFLWQKIELEKCFEREKRIIRMNEDFLFQQSIKKNSIKQGQLEKEEEDDLIDDIPPEKNNFNEDYIYKQCKIENENNIPSVDTVASFIKNIVISSKMEAELLLISAIYIERFLAKNSKKVKFSNLTFKRIIFIGLELASKIWDDDSFETGSFSQTFSNYPTLLINTLEKIFLKVVNYHLVVDKDEYAEMYFKVRKNFNIHDKKHKSHNQKYKDLRGILKGYREQSIITKELPQRKSF